MSNISSSEYAGFLSEIKRRITSARIQAARTVNKSLIGLYWDIGKVIVEKQAKYQWGQSVVEKLARDLVDEDKSFEGFSANNLWRMRHFYMAYRGKSKLAQLVQEIPWGQNIVILQMVKDQKELKAILPSEREMKGQLLLEMKSGGKNKKQ